MKITLLFLVLIISSQAYSQTKHLVFNITDFLIQGVPIRNAGTFADKDRVFKLTDGGRDRYYYPAPYVEEVISKLVSHPQFTVHFVSYYGNRDWAKRALSNIFTSSKKDVSLLKLIEAKGNSKILGQEDLDSDKKIKIDLISKDLKSILFFTSKKDQLPKSAQDQEVFPGRDFYVFESFKNAQDEAKRVGNIPNIPDTEEDWYLERHRFPRVLFAVIQALKTKKFLEEVKAVLADKDKKSVVIGIKQTSPDWAEIGPRFIIRLKKVTGCAEYNNLTDDHLRDLPLSACQTEALTTPKLLVTQDSVKGCAIHTKEEEVFVADVSMSTCLNKLNLKSYWKGKPRTKCLYYTNDLLEVADAPKNLCEKSHVLSHPKTADRVLIEESDDFDSLTLEQLFTKDDPTPTVPFKLFFNYDNRPDVGFTLAKCRVPEIGDRTIKRDATGNLAKVCQPDTLYSWGPMAKKDSIESWMGGGAWTKNMRALFMTRSPVGTFGYGEVPLRLKLKPNLNWVQTTQAHGVCNSVTEAEKQNTVFYRPYNYMSYRYLLDYIICSGGPVASWSYGQKEHYDEIIKEYKWITTKPETEFELYITGAGALQAFYGGIDGYNFSEATLTYYLKNMQEMIKKKSGKIYFNPDIPQNERTSSEHFKTSIPMYYNHR